MLTFSINPRLNDDKLQKIDRLIKQIAIRKLKEVFTYETDKSVLYNVLSDPRVFKMLKNILGS